MKHYTFTEAALDAFTEEVDLFWHQRLPLDQFAAWLERQSSKGRHDLAIVTEDLPKWPVKTFTGEEVLADE